MSDPKDEGGVLHGPLLHQGDCNPIAITKAMIEGGMSVELPGALKCASVYVWVSWIENKKAAPPGDLNWTVESLLAMVAKVAYAQGLKDGGVHSTLVGSRTH